MAALLNGNSGAGGSLMEMLGAEDWIRGHVRLGGSPVVVHERPWSTVMRVPLADGGAAWFKSCAPVQGFEPALTATLSRRWPGLVVEVIASEPERGWLLMGDAGTRLIEIGNPPEVWLRLLPHYAELQRGEAERTNEHLEAGVPDLRPCVLPVRYEALVESELPIERGAHRRLREFAPELSRLCAALAESPIPVSVQHDDLHMGNVYLRDDRVLVLDWGDTSIAHPFWSLVVPFRFLEERNGLASGDPWFERLRDAYLEPWGSGLRDTFDLALRVGIFAHAVAWLRQRDHLSANDRVAFDADYPVILNRALERVTA